MLILFSKKSSCYLELDTHFECIANKYETFLDYESRSQKSEEIHSQLSSSKYNSQKKKLNNIENLSQLVIFKN